MRSRQPRSRLQRAHAGTMIRTSLRLPPRARGMTCSRVNGPSGCACARQYAHRPASMCHSSSDLRVRTGFRLRDLFPGNFATKEPPRKAGGRVPRESLTHCPFTPYVKKSAISCGPLRPESDSPGTRPIERTGHGIGRLRPSRSTSLLVHPPPRPRGDGGDRNTTCAEWHLYGTWSLLLVTPNPA